MDKLQALLELEKRNQLPEDKRAVLSELRKRGVVPQNEVEQDTSLSRTLLDQSLQGGTFGFSDEITDRIGALGASAITGMKYGDLLKTAREETKLRLAQQQEKRPITSIVANVAGGIINPATLAVTPAALTGSVGAQIAKGAALGGGSGALYGAGTTEDDRFAGAAIGGVTGAALGAAVPAAIGAVKGTKTLQKGMNAQNAEALNETVDTIKKAAASKYKAMRQSGLVFNDRLTTRLGKVVDKRLSDFGNLNPDLQPKTVKQLSAMAEKLTAGQIGIDDLDDLSKQFSNIINDNTQINGRLTSDGAAASIVKNTIDDLLRGVSKKDLQSGSPEGIKLLQEARKEWSKGAKLDTVSELVRRAELAGGTAKDYKIQAKNILNSKKKTRGMSKQELDLFRRAATDSSGEVMLKLLGSFGVEKNSILMPTILGLGGLTTGGAAVLPTAAAIGTGTLARQAKNLTAKARVQDLVNQIVK